MEQNQPQPPVFNQQSVQQPGPQYQYGSPTMSFGTAIKTCFKKYFDFKGRARRSEYWWFVLFIFLASVAWCFIGSILSAFVGEVDMESGGSVQSFLITTLAIIILPLLVFVIPQYAAMTRRLHDIGRSGWWVVLSIVISVAYTGLYLNLLAPMLSSMMVSPDPSTQADIMTEMLTSQPGMMAVVGILGMASMILSIVLLIFSVTDSQREANKYGPSPKYQ